MNPLHYATCVNRFGKEVALASMHWPDFEMLWLSGHDIRDSKDGCGLIFATFSQPLRAAANVVGVTALALDIDGKQAKPPAFSEALSRLDLLGVLAGAWTTYQHTEAAPRYRLLVPLAEPMPPKALPYALQALADALGLSAFMDSACKDPARLFYAPSCPASHAGEARVWCKVEGQALSAAPFVHQVEMAERAAKLKATMPRKPSTASNPRQLLQRAASAIQSAPERNVALNRWGFIVGKAASKGEITANEAQVILLDAALAVGLPSREANYTLNRAMRQGVQHDRL